MLLYGILTLQTAGTLEATVDWTFASNNLLVGWAQGDCDANPACQILVGDGSAQKPKTVKTATVQPGKYTLIIENDGTTNESISYQIFHTASVAQLAALGRASSVGPKALRLELRAVPVSMLHRGAAAGPRP